MNIIQTGSEFCTIQVSTKDFPSARIWFLKKDFEIKCIGILDERIKSEGSLIRYGSTEGRRVGPLLDMANYGRWHQIDDTMFITEHFKNGVIRFYVDDEGFVEIEVRGNLNLSKATKAFFESLRKH